MLSCLRARITERKLNAFENIRFNIQILKKNEQLKLEYLYWLVSA